MTLSAFKRLGRFYSNFKSDNNVLIVINADPDSMASAMALKRLLWRKVTEVTICNINIIKRPDNIAMTNLLNIKMNHISEIEVTKFDKFILVDSQPSHNELFDSFNFDIIIDHHPVTDIKASYLDIRPEYGATASIMTEYLRAAAIKPSAKLATALSHAIKIDTNSFVRKTIIEDVHAFQFLFRYTNVYLAQRIEQAEITSDFLIYFQRALRDNKMKRGRNFTHLGEVITPDVCVLIADFFMKVHSVKWSIASGIYNNTLIVIFRNDGLNKNAGRLASIAFGSLGSAGGHKSMARAEISLDKIKDLVNYKSNRKMLAWIIESIEKKV